MSEECPAETEIDIKGLSQITLCTLLSCFSLIALGLVSGSVAFWGKKRKERNEREWKWRCKPVFSSLHSLFYPVWLVPQSEDHFGYWKYHMQEKHCNLGAARMFSDSMNLAGMRLPWAKPVTKSSKIARFFFSPSWTGNWVHIVASMTGQVRVFLWKYVNVHPHIHMHAYLFSCCLSCHRAVFFGKEGDWLWAWHFSCLSLEFLMEYTSPLCPGNWGSLSKGAENASWKAEHIVHWHVNESGWISGILLSPFHCRKPERSLPQIKEGQVMFC